MHALILSLALLAGLATDPGPPLSEWAAYAPPAPLCAVQALATPSWLGYVLTVAPTKDCPPDGHAEVRFHSTLGGILGGTQPDDPPGFFVLRPGEYLRRHVPASWFVERRARTGGPWWPVPDGREP